MIIEEIRNIKESKKDLRNFGLLVGAVFVLIGVFLYFVQGEYYYFTFLIGILLILSGLLFPKVLKPLNRIWMIIAILLGFVMTRVILSVLFYLIITPIGLIARIFGKDFLDLDIPKGNKTYWIKKEVQGNIKENYERQF